jgi:hypothetical protein
MRIQNLSNGCFGLRDVGRIKMALKSRIGQGASVESPGDDVDGADDVDDADDTDDEIGKKRERDEYEQDEALLPKKKQTVIDDFLQNEADSDGNIKYSY